MLSFAYSKISNAGNNITSAFNGADDGRLIDYACLTLALAPFVLMAIAGLPADIGFINFDRAR